MANLTGQDEEASIQSVLSALDALYKNPDNQAKQQANTWLQDFQKTPQAWQTANTLLLAQELPLESRLFGAQTFRVKCTYDIYQIPRESLSSLRSTLISALQAYKQGPRVVQTQICLALAGLALQLKNGEDPEWGDDVVRYMIDHFGKDPQDIAVLLEFLTVLPEELTTNQRIPVDGEHYDVRSVVLMQRPSLDVLRILSMFIQAEGTPPNIREAVFSCLASWLKAGEISIQALMPTPLFSMSFDSLAEDQLFDVAVDIICDIINETQETEEYPDAINLIANKLLVLRPELLSALSEQDDDKVRGLCRIFVQAGETYHRLIMQHYSSFAPIVEAIFECARYHDLDIVQITFRFWYYLAQDIARDRENLAITALAPIFQQLLQEIIKHLRFPDDLDAWTGQERDNFKSFRHYMGDTLKDCCSVLGSPVCLSRSLAMIQEIVAKADGQASNVKWQDVEAPLFSMRAMGARADPHDETIVPVIIDVIPTLPNHPRLTYAGLLVMARYTGWIKYHPQRIPSVLSYISAGFSSTDTNVAAAAASAFNYLGQDCDVELTPFLPQLFDFYQSVIDRVEAEDAKSIAEACAYVIASLPSEQASEPLLRFAQPLLQGLADVAGADGIVDKLALQKTADRMEQLERFLAIVGRTTSSATLPSSCVLVAKEALSVIETILSKYGHFFFITERSCELLRRGIAFYDLAAAPLAGSLLKRLIALFEQTGYASYLWIIGKTVYAYGGHGVADAEMSEAFERSTSKVALLLQDKSPADIPDVLDDYLHTCSVVAEIRPQDIFHPQLFELVFRIAVSVLQQQVYQQSAIRAGLDLLRNIVGHDAFSQQKSTAGHQSTQAVELITTVAMQQGAVLVGLLLNLVVSSSFEADMLLDVGIIMRQYSINVDAANQGRSVYAWLEEAITKNLNERVISAKDKQSALQALRRGGSELTAANVAEAIKPTLQTLFAASRRSRDRDRAGGGGNGTFED